MGHVVKAKERAEVKRYGGRLHHLSFNRSPAVGVHIQQVLSTLNVYHFLLILPWCSLLLQFLLCLNRFFLSLAHFFEDWRRSPPAATEDNYTNTDKSASTVTHSRVGFLPYATSYRLQRLCKTEKKTGKSGAGHKNGVPKTGETRDDGKRKEDQITSPTKPLTSTHWGQKNHTGFLKFQLQYFLS